MLAYFAIAENESIGRERYNFMQVYMETCLHSPTKLYLKSSVEQVRGINIAVKFWHYGSVSKCNDCIVYLSLQVRNATSYVLPLFQSVSDFYIDNSIRNCQKLAGAALLFSHNATITTYELGTSFLQEKWDDWV
jgi:hypothetical protein